MDSLAEQTLLELREERRTRFYGKYRGVVKDVLTGDDLGKLSVLVPAVLGDVAAVAWPCVPFAGPKHGFVALPEEKDGVWIEFEGGNPSQPIWTGCWWGAGDMPSPGGAKVRSWVTSGGLSIALDDDQNEIALKHPDGPSITITSDSITLSLTGATITLGSDGISLKGPTEVSQ